MCGARAGPDDGRGHSGVHGGRVTEARPQWWLMENVPGVPDLTVGGYTWQRIDYCAPEAGGAQSRDARGRLRWVAAKENPAGTGTEPMRFQPTWGHGPRWPVGRSRSLTGGGGGLLGAEVPPLSRRDFCNHQKTMQIVIIAPPTSPMRPQKA